MARDRASKAKYSVFVGGSVIFCAAANNDVRVRYVFGSYRNNNKACKVCAT